ncbi:hypothetical protein [Streptomyces sp. NPDC005017]|uniref:hypothetical protein n=1 Tax=Streptomyces sp. NPDC005017 TaxID=3364706 RepID=UPI0036A7FE78
MRALVIQTFGTQKKAAAHMGRSETWLSRNLNARDDEGNTRMPGRKFVDVVLAACQVSGEQRDRTRDLYMEALASVDEARHAGYRAADRAAAAENRCEQALRTLDGLRARFALQAEQHARELARLESGMERREGVRVGDVAAAARELERKRAGELAAAQKRERQWAEELATARARISERSEQLSAERQGRRVDRATIEALRGELVKAHSTIEALHGELTEARTAAPRQEPWRHEREEAVLAEAIAVTEQALAAERERAETDQTPALGEETDRRKPPTGRILITSGAGFVLMVLSALVAVATDAQSKAAADLDWAVIDALRGNAVAGGAATLAFFVGCSVWLCGLLALVVRNDLHTGETSVDDVLSTWI